MKISIIFSISERSLLTVLVNPILWKMVDKLDLIIEKVTPIIIHHQLCSEPTNQDRFETVIESLTSPEREIWIADKLLFIYCRKRNQSTVAQMQKLYKMIHASQTPTTPTNHDSCLVPNPVYLWCPSTLPILRLSCQFYQEAFQSRNQICPWKLGWATL